MTADTWFAIPTPRPAAIVRLVCFPHAGGGASAFFPWSKALAAHPVEVAALKLPGREGRLREPACADLCEIVAAIVGALPPVGDRPIAFFGHSSGARMAFETARRLRALGRRLPLHLFVSGASAPNVLRTGPPLHLIRDETAFMNAVSRRYGGIPETVMQHVELRSLVAPALRADLTMHERYVYQDAPPLPIAITAYGGEQDAAVSPDGLGRWQEHTTNRFASRMFAGDHFFLNQHRDALLADVIARLTAQNVI